MAEGVEIKELFIAESVADNDTMLIQQEGATKQINFETLRKKSAEKAISENNLVDEEQLTDAVAVVIDDLDAVKAKLPSTASADNQLADKDFVNSSIATNTAHYISNNGQEFNSVEELEAYSGAVTPNDYAFVKGVDEGGNVFYDRYKANVVMGVVTWAKEYRLNNSSFTAEQWAAIQSGITAELVALIGQASGSSPIGTIANYIGSTAPAGWLLMNNERQLLIEDYPKLYDRVKDIPAFQSENEGYFTLPDLSELVLVGAGENGSFDIASHDIYDIGQFKDDQFQDHIQIVSAVESNHDYEGAKNAGFNVSSANRFDDNIRIKQNSGTISDANSNLFIARDILEGYGRHGTTTHGKQFGINYIIKATSTNDSLDDVIDDSTKDVGHAWSGAKVAEEIGKVADYSTEETVVGKWIDGKPIYRKVFTFNPHINIYKNWVNIKQVENEDIILSATILIHELTEGRQSLCAKALSCIRNGYIQIMVTELIESSNTDTAILEYTKTTD